MVGQAIFEGLATGLLLSVFVGPIFFTMLQLGVEHGFKAALALAVGQWTSDFLFIGIAFGSAKFVKRMVENPIARENFIWYSGTIGGVLLVLFGLALLLTKSASTEPDHTLEEVVNEVEDSTPRKSFLPYFAYWMQGFLINTINPTPLLFWMGIMGAAISRDFSTTAVTVNYSVVMAVVIGTDLAKIYLAKYIKKRIKPRHILSVRRLAGTVLAIFGFILVIKVTIL